MAGPAAGCLLRPRHSGDTHGIPAEPTDDRNPAGRLPGAPNIRARIHHPAGRPPHAAPTLFSLYGYSFWLPTVAGAARLGNVEAHPWLALSIIEGEHDSHAAVLTEGPAEVLATVPDDVRNLTEQRNRGGSLDWATAWIRISPQRLFSFAEVAWPGASA